MKYLKEQLDVEGDNQVLLSFLCRKHGNWVSEISIGRWLYKEQFANATARRQIAKALGLDESVVESFLMHGVPDWETFASQIPPIDKEYKRSQSIEIVVDSKSVTEVFDAINRLLDCLPLEWLIRLRNDVNNKIDRQASILGLCRQSFEKHPLRLLIIDSICRSKLTIAQFIETVSQKKHEGLDSSVLAEIIRGDRLPNRQEVKFLSLEIKDGFGNYYPLEYLLNLLSDHSGSPLSINGTQKIENFKDCQNCNGGI